jgi:hypothetical protein
MLTPLRRRRSPDAKGSATATTSSPQCASGVRRHHGRSATATARRTSFSDSRARRRRSIQAQPLRRRRSPDAKGSVTATTSPRQWVSDSDVRQRPRTIKRRRRHTSTQRSHSHVADHQTTPAMSGQRQGGTATAQNVVDWSNTDDDTRCPQKRHSLTMAEHLDQKLSNVSTPSSHCDTLFADRHVRGHLQIKKQSLICYMYKYNF